MPLDSVNPDRALIDRLKSYAVAVGEELGYTKPKTVAEQLGHFGLAAGSFVTQFAQKGG
jgi:hypothetical protein